MKMNRKYLAFLLMLVVIIVGGCVRSSGQRAGMPVTGAISANPPVQNAIVTIPPVKNKHISSDEKSSLDRARRMTEDGKTFYLLASYEKAIPLFKEALDIVKNVLGPNHPYVSDSMENLAFAYEGAGRHGMANKLFSGALHVTPLADQDVSKAFMADSGKGKCIHKGTMTLEMINHVFDQGKSGIAICLDNPDNSDEYAMITPYSFFVSGAGKKCRTAKLVLVQNKKQQQDVFTFCRNSKGNWDKEEETDNDSPARTEDQKQQLARTVKLENQGRQTTTSKETVLSDLPIRRLTSGELRALFSAPDKDPIDVSDALMGEAKFLYQQGKYAQAISIGEKAFQIRRQILGLEHPLTASSLHNLALYHSSLGHDEEAEPFLKQALLIDKKVFGPEHPATVNMLDNLAALYKNFGPYSKAIPLYKSLLAIREKMLGPEHPDTATSLYNLSLVYHSLGQYDLAKSLNKRALKIREEVLGPEHRDTVASLEELGMLYYNLGQNDMALPLLKRALKISEKVMGLDHPDVAVCLNNLALVYNDLEQNDQARALYERALKVTNNRHHRAWYLDNLAFLDLAQGRIDQAMARFKVRNIHDGLGCCFLARQEFNRAEQEFATELELVLNMDDEQHIANLIGLGLAREGLNRLEQAVQNFQEAVILIEERYETLSPAARRSFLGGGTALNFKRLDAYEGLIRTLIKQKKPGYAAHALQVAEKIKSRTLLEQLAARGAQGVSREDARTLKKDREFQQKIFMLSKQLQVLNNLKPVPRGKVAEVENKLAKIRTEYETFINEVKLNNRELASLISEQTIPVTEIQTLLDPDTTLVEYFTGSKNSYVWTITRDDIQVRKLGIAGEKIAGLVNDFRTVLLRSDTTRSARMPKMILLPGSLLQPVAQPVTRKKRLADVTRRAYRQLIEPVRDRILTEKLIIVPHGPLHKLPFAALSHEGRYLMEDYVISTAPSASVLSYVSKKRNPNNGRLLAFANPTTILNVELPATEEEVAHIKKLFPGKATIYKRANATETRARLQSSQPDVLHFASHGEFNDRQPMQSGLLLSKDSKNDGKLQVHELFGLNLKNANLVTLSACQTALTKIESGDDMIGLSRGFIYAGTPSLLASLWGVEDQSTSLLMQNFYDNWINKKMSKPEALRQAQIQVRNNPATSDPYFWAAFEMIGDWQ